MGRFSKFYDFELDLIEDGLRKVMVDGIKSEDTKAKFVSTELLHDIIQEKNRRRKQQGM